MCALVFFYVDKGPVILEGCSNIQPEAHKTGREGDTGGKLSTVEKCKEIIAFC